MQKICCQGNRGECVCVSESVREREGGWDTLWIPGLLLQASNTTLHPVRIATADLQPVSVHIWRLSLISLNVKAAAAFFFFFFLRLPSLFREQSALNNIGHNSCSVSAPSPLISSSPPPSVSTFLSLLRLRFSRPPRAFLTTSVRFVSPAQSKQVEQQRARSLRMYIRQM